MDGNNRVLQVKPITEIRLLSANIRGFHTNTGELTHQFVLKNKVDIVFLEETFLDDNVSPNYARIPGYTLWHRKDRNTQGGGVALCYKDDLQLQIIDTDIPIGLEVIIFKLIDREGRGILCCGCYRPPSQGTQLLDFFMDNLDNLLKLHNCHNIILFGDMNQHRIQEAFDHLLAVYDLQNHVDFPTHSSGSSLDPVLTDLPLDTVSCFPLGFVGTSDHIAVLTKLKVGKSKEESRERTFWMWNDADWTGFKNGLTEMEWNSLLQGSVHEQSNLFTAKLLELQYRYVPHKTYTSKSSDQPWFGPQCKAASDKKYRAWIRFKRNPTTHNKTTS